MITNNRNFRVLATAFMFTVFGSLLSAQPGGQQGGQQGPPPVPNEKQVNAMVKDLSKELSLSKDQDAQVSAIYVNHFKQVRAKVSGNKRMGPDEMQTLDSKLEKKVKGVLNADQKKLYAKWLKKQAKERASRSPQGGARPPRK